MGLTAPAPPGDDIAIAMTAYGHASIVAKAMQLAFNRP